MSDTAAPEKPGRRSRRRGAAILAGGIASSGFFLWLVARDADLDAVWRALRGADLGRVALAAVVVQAVYLAQGARWRLIADAMHLSVRRFYALVLGGIGANNLLPLRIGDILRGRWLAKAAPMPTGRAFGSVFRDRASDVVVLVLGLAVAIPFVGGAAWVARIAFGGVALIAVILLLLLAAVIYTRVRPRARRGARSRLRRLLRDALDEIASPMGRRRLVPALALSAVAWGFWALSAVLVCSSLGVTLSPAEAVFVTAVVNLGVAIPSSPGFVGTYQWLAVAALGVAGVDGDVAIAFSLLMQAVWFVPTTLVGGVIAVREVHRDAARAGPETEAPVPSPR